MLEVKNVQISQNFVFCNFRPRPLTAIPQKRLGQLQHPNIYSNPPIYRASRGKTKMHVKSGARWIGGKLTHVFYCKTRYRKNTKRHVISRDRVNRGPVNWGITVYMWVHYSTEKKIINKDSLLNNEWYKSMHKYTNRNIVYHLLLFKTKLY